MDLSFEFLQNIHVKLYILAYLLGGVPFGYLLAKFFAKVDIKSEGSFSIGATNVLRVVKQKDPALAKKLGAATVALDALKGIVPLVVGIVLGVDVSVLWAMAVLSVLGHCFSPYLGFEGGKGVATGFGVLLVLAPVQSLIAFTVWLIFAKIIKISSLSSLAALAALIGSAAVYPNSPFYPGSISPLVIIAILVVYKHLPNIYRLFTKQEQKVA